jgi:hypothetical protein
VNLGVDDRQWSEPGDAVIRRRGAFPNIPVQFADDAEFLAAARIQQLEVSPVSGEQIQDILARISKTPKDVIRALRDVVLGAEASAAMEKH